MNKNYELYKNRRIVAYLKNDRQAKIFKALAFSEKKKDSEKFKELFEQFINSIPKEKQDELLKAYSEGKFNYKTLDW